MSNRDKIIKTIEERLKNHSNSEVRKSAKQKLKVLQSNNTVQK